MQSVAAGLLGREAAFGGGAKTAAQPSGVYIGVGTEQNFTYIAAVTSKLAFVSISGADNMLEHLMYKALFELSPDRADFVSPPVFPKRPDIFDAECERTNFSVRDALFQQRSNRIHADTKSDEETLQRLRCNHLVNQSRISAQRGRYEGPFGSLLDAFRVAGP